MNASPLGISLCQGPLLLGMCALQDLWCLVDTSAPLWYPLAWRDWHRDSSVSHWAQGQLSVLVGNNFMHCQRQGQVNVHSGDNSIPIGHEDSSMSLCQLCAPTGHRGESVSPVGWGQLEWLCDTMECDTSGHTEPTPPYRGLWLVLGDKWALRGP